MENEKNQSEPENTEANKAKVKALSTNLNRKQQPLLAVSTKRDFGIIAKQFEGETKEVQNTMIAISGMLQVVKMNIGEQPVVVAYLVKKYVPELGELAILGNLQLGCESMNFTNMGSVLTDFLSQLPVRLKEMENSQWDTFWHGMFTGMSYQLLPFSKVVLYSEYVYQTLIKGIVK